MDNCVSVYPAQTYTQMAEQALSQVPNPLSQQGRELRRLLYGNALETELDSAGRGMLTPRFLEHAGVGREGVTPGVGDSLELGARPPGEGYESDLTARASDLTESLGHTT